MITCQDQDSGIEATTESLVWSSSMHAMLNLRLGYISAEHGRKRLPLVVDPILGDADSFSKVPSSRDSSHILLRTDCSADKFPGVLQDLTRECQLLTCITVHQHCPNVFLQNGWT